MLSKIVPFLTTIVIGLLALILIGFNIFHSDAYVPVINTHPGDVIQLNAVEKEVTTVREVMETDGVQQSYHLLAIPFSATVLLISIIYLKRIKDNYDKLEKSK